MFSFVLLMEVTPFTCPLCLDVVAGARIASCGHIYCGTCYYDMVHRVASARCAICRAQLAMVAYPSFDVDAMLDQGDDEAFRERVRASRERAKQLEMCWVAGDDTLAHHALSLTSENVRERCVGLNGLLRNFNRSTGNTCSELGAPALSRIIGCGSAPSCREELTLAWRALAHIATYFPDGARLMSSGIVHAALQAAFSREATVGSMRAVTRAVMALVASHPQPFLSYLEPPHCIDLLTVAPALLGHVAMQTSGGIERLAAENVLAYLLPVASLHDRVLAKDLMDAAVLSEHPEVKSQARRAASMMLCEPIRHSASLAAVAWRDQDAAMVFATLHHRDVLHAVRAASESDDFDSQMSILDFLHALHDMAKLRLPVLATEVLAWVFREATDPNVRSFGLSYASAVCRHSEACAIAVSDTSGGPARMLADPTDGAMLYLAGDVLSHEHIALTHTETLAEALARLTFLGFEEVYVASCLAEHATGVELLRPHALARIRDVAQGKEEVISETARQVVETCDCV
jgi:hypothetical protein